MEKYDPIRGVPPLSYYIEEVVSFGDFESSCKTQIIYTSTNKQELIDLCVKNNWACPDLNNAKSGWYTHFIKYRFY